MTDIKSKVVLVTGSSRGLGWVTAFALTKQEANAAVQEILYNKEGAIVILR